MSMRVGILLRLAAIGMIAGCEDAKHPPVAKPLSAAATPASAPSEADIVPTDVQADAAAKMQSAPAQESMPEEKSAVSPVEPKTDAKGESEPNVDAHNERSPPPAPERVAILTPGGPLLLDVRFEIDGKPYSS